MKISLKKLLQGESYPKVVINVQFQRFHGFQEDDKPQIEFYPCIDVRTMKEHRIKHFTKIRLRNEDETLPKIFEMRLQPPDVSRFHIVHLFETIAHYDYEI
uniref:Uncharacterized protein n=1 Tax=Romanomermis culicivorax TaxID=13658 RepID=A0A915HH74_ROMCU